MPPLPIAFHDPDCCQADGLNAGWLLVAEEPEPLRDLEYQ